MPQAESPATATTPPASCGGRSDTTGQIIVFNVDGLGRVVTTIANYHNGSVEVADGVDRDVITTTSYDVAGRTIETTEPARQITTPPTASRRTAFPVKWTMTPPIG